MGKGTQSSSARVCLLLTNIDGVTAVTPSYIEYSVTYKASNDSGSKTLYGPLRADTSDATAQCPAGQWGIVLPSSAAEWKAGTSPEQTLTLTLAWPLPNGRQGTHSADYTITRAAFLPTVLALPTPTVTPTP
jgi:hypothetical protein